MKPDDVPSSSMAGGIRLITVPSLVWAMACWARETSSCAVAPSRWGQSLSMVNASAELGPEPEKPKPITVWLVAMPGRAATCAS